jgi:hypothetical protein
MLLQFTPVSVTPVAAAVQVSTPTLLLSAMKLPKVEVMKFVTKKSTIAL